MKRRGHGEGTITERSDGRWAAAVDLGIQDGKRSRKWLYGKTRKEVSEKLTRALKDAQDGIAPADNRITLAAWLESHLEDLEARGAVVHNTLVRYRGILDKHVRPALGHVRLGQLQPQHIQRYQSDLLKRGVAAKSVVVHRSLLSGALRQAVAYGMIPRNPVSVVKPPSRAKDEPKGRALSPDEARRLLDATAGDRLAVYYLLLLTAGLRRGEALGLRWQDVEIPPGDDLDLVGTGLVHVRQQLQWPNGEPTAVRLKSRKGMRDVPIPSITVRALCARRAVQRADYAARGAPWRPAELVMTTVEGKPVHRNSITTQFHGYRAAAGLPHYRPHDLRHTYGSLLMAQGVPLKTISELMGHASIEVTADIYLHSQVAQVRDTADLVGRALVGGTEAALVCTACGRPL